MDQIPFCETDLDGSKVEKSSGPLHEFVELQRQPNFGGLVW